MDHRPVHQAKGDRRMRLKDQEEGLASGKGAIRNWTRLSLVLLRLLLGVIFVYASFDKILRPAAFAEIIYNYQILPDPLINFNGGTHRLFRGLLSPGIMRQIW